MRTTSSSPVSRKNYWKGKSNLVEQFLQKRGLQLSPTKTVITHVEKGFDFLGQNVRRYPNGKLLIKPSKKNVKTFLEGVRRTIKAALGSSSAALIEELNPKIRGWANCHRHVVSKRTFTRVDHAIFSRLWQWARRRHRNKNPRWIKAKYSERHRDRDWSFVGETYDHQGQPYRVAEVQRLSRRTISNQCIDWGGLF
jgi:RNA-directed DNA polymerase